jgi:hypothetical protein
MAEEDESENADTIDADAVLAAMMAETAEERAARQERSDALEAAEAEKEHAARQQQRRDIGGCSITSLPIRQQRFPGQRRHCAMLSETFLRLILTKRFQQ